MTARAPKPRRVTGECWCCGTWASLGSSGKGNGLCRRCAGRWSAHGWAGPGPGQDFSPRIDRAREAAQIITMLSARRAAERLGVSARTVIRYRRALREAA